MDVYVGDLVVGELVGGVGVFVGAVGAAVGGVGVLVVGELVGGVGADVVGESVVGVLVVGVPVVGDTVGTKVVTFASINGIVTPSTIPDNAIKSNAHWSLLPKTKTVMMGIACTRDL